MAIAENIAKRAKPRRNVPWRPLPNIAKRARIAARLKRGRITEDQQNAAIAAAGHLPQQHATGPALHHELRKTLGEVKT